MTVQVFATTPAWGTSLSCRTPRSSTTKFTARPISRSSQTLKTLCRLVPTARICLPREAIDPVSAFREIQTLFLPLWETWNVKKVTVPHMGLSSKKRWGVATGPGQKKTLLQTKMTILWWGWPSGLFVDLWRRLSWWSFSRDLSRQRMRRFVCVCIVSRETVLIHVLRDFVTLMKGVGLCVYEKMYYCLCGLWEFGLICRNFHLDSLYWA